MAAATKEESREEQAEEAVLHTRVLGFKQSLALTVCLWPLDVEKSDGVRREKWREKDKTTVGWRAFDVLYLCVCWGPETQVLKVKPSVRLLRSWNLGPESQISRS
jgi:hypothetical protein